MSQTYRDPERNREPLVEDFRPKQFTMSTGPGGPVDLDYQNRNIVNLKKLEMELGRDHLKQLAGLIKDELRYGDMMVLTKAMTSKEGYTPPATANDLADLLYSWADGYSARQSDQ